MYTQVLVSAKKTVLVDRYECFKGISVFNKKT